MSHTPGPWRQAGSEIRDADGKAVANLTTRANKAPAQRASDARLSVADPDMLDALEMFEAWYRRGVQWSTFDSQLGQIDRAIHAAIGRARGTLAEGGAKE